MIKSIKLEKLLTYYQNQKLLSLVSEFYNIHFKEPCKLIPPKKIILKEKPMIFPKYPIIGLILLFLPSFSFTQVVEKDFIDIHLTIREKVGNETAVLPNAKLKISDLGDVSTDGNGQYVYTYAVQEDRDPEISISLLSGKHKLLKPLDGSIVVDPTQEKLYIDFLVVNMAEESLEFQKRMNELDGKIATLQRKNQLTKQQLSRLNNTLLDTILYFEAVRNDLEMQIESAEALNEEQKSALEAQQTEIARLSEKVNSLTQELTEALEAKYLRQNEYFKDISSNLVGFVRSAKDLEEHLPHIKTYYSANDFRSMDRDVRLYEEHFVEISDRHQEYLEGVDRYWENPDITKELEDVFDLLMKGIHLNQIRPVVNDIFDQISKGKPNKAQKMAESSHVNIALNIRNLEKKINRILIELRNN